MSRSTQRSGHQPEPRLQRPAKPPEAPTEVPTTYRVESPISGFAILPLRVFLGITFVYAGIQKLQDPNFLRPGTPTYIGSQLLAFSRGSPIRTLLLHMMEHAAAIGILTILTEMTIGILVLLGLFTRPASLIGLVLNAAFFLSASWHTYPYFYGADIVFVAAWLTLFLTGPGPWALDDTVQPLLLARVRQAGNSASANALRLLLLSPSASGRRVAAPQPGPSARIMTRAEALIGAIGALVVIVLGLIPRATSSSAATKLAGPSAAATPNPTPGHAPTPSAAKTPSSGGSAPAGMKKIGNVSQLPGNSAGMVSDPKSGDPVIVVHTSGSSFYAYDAVCTHAGCTVQYDPQQKMIVCPCHGGTFDPTHGAQVVAGPPPSPLSPIEMTIDKSGNIYIV